MTDRELLALQPEFIQGMFPAFLTHRSGIDVKLLQQMRAASFEGMPLGGFRSVLRQQTYAEYALREMKHYSKLCWWKNGGQAPVTLVPTWLGDEPTWAFPDFDKEYGGYVPSGMFCCEARVHICTSFNPYCSVAQCDISGRYCWRTCSGFALTWTGSS